MSEMIQTKTVRELQLNDEVVVSVQECVRTVEVSAAPLLGEELATIVVDGGEPVVVRAPKAQPIASTTWQQNEKWSEEGAAMLLAGTVHTETSSYDVYIPGSLDCFSKGKTNYQTDADVAASLQQYALSSWTQIKLDQKADTSAVAVLAKTAALSASMAEGIKSLSNTVLSNFALKSDMSAYAQASYVSATYAATSALDQLKIAHNADSCGLSARIDNVYAQMAARADETDAKLAKLEARLDNFGDSGQSGDESQSKPLAGKTYDIGESSLDTLLCVVLEALGSGSSTGPLAGKTYDLEKATVEEVLSDVLSVLGAEVTPVAD